MREINLTEGNDAKLNALMKRRGELFPVELSEEVKAEVVSRIGTRTACSCVVTDKGRVLVDISGELPSGGYILAVYGVLDGHKWRSACRGLHITKVTMPGIGNGMIAEGDPYDIEMEVEMYIQPSSNEAIRIHNEDGEAHADIRRMIPKIPANIVTDENYHHTDENYTSDEKEKLARLENYDDTQIRQMIAETSGNFVNYYQKKDSYSKLQVDNMLQAIKNGMFVTYEGEELPEPTEDWIGKILLFRNEVPLEELPEEEEPIVDPDQPIHEPEEVIEEEEIVDGNRGLRNTRTAPVSTNYYEEYIVIADEQHPVEKLAGINELTGEEEFELIYPLKWECIGSVKIDLSGYATTEEMIEAIREAAEGKVDKIPGKGLSTNDFTNKDKQKLDELTPTEEQVQTDWNENDALSKAHVKNRTHYTEIISGEPVVYDSIFWNRSTYSTLRFEEDGYGTDEGGTYLTLQPSVITSNPDQGTQEKRFSKPIIFKLDDDTNIASAIIDKAQIRIQEGDYETIELYFYKVDKNTNKLYFRETFIFHSGVPSSYEREADIIDGYVNLEVGGDSGCTLEALDFTETEVVHKLDNKFLNLDEEVNQESKNPVENQAVYAHVSSERYQILTSIFELLNSGYYDKEQVDELLKAVATGSFVAAEILPQPSEECLGKIYLIPHPDPETENIRDEYICIPNPDYVEGESEAEDQYIWENIGSTKIDLSDYYTKSDVDAILKASQADWNASDVDSLAHVKNRTHYEEKDVVISSFIDEQVSMTVLEKTTNLDGYHRTWKVQLNIGDYSKIYSVELSFDDYSPEDFVKTDLRYGSEFLQIGVYAYDNQITGMLGLLLMDPEEASGYNIITNKPWNDSDSAGASYSLGTISADRIGDIVKKLDPKFLPDGTKIPDGGTAGQILSKKTDADQDVEWTTLQQEFLLLDFNQSVNVNAPAIASGSNPVNIDVNVPESYQADWKISSLPKFECKNGTTRVDVVFGSAFSMNGQKTLRLRTFACGTETKQITSIAGAMLLMKR